MEQNKFLLYHMSCQRFTLIPSLEDSSVSALPLTVTIFNESTFPNQSESRIQARYDRVIACQRMKAKRAARLLLY